MLPGEAQVCDPIVAYLIQTLRKAKVRSSPIFSQKIKTRDVRHYRPTDIIRQLTECVQVNVGKESKWVSNHNYPLTSVLDR